MEGFKLNLSARTPISTEGQIIIRQTTHLIWFKHYVLCSLFSLDIPLRKVMDIVLTKSMTEKVPILMTSLERLWILHVNLLFYARTLYDELFPTVKSLPGVKKLVHHLAKHKVSKYLVVVTVYITLFCKLSPCPRSLHL